MIIVLQVNSTHTQQVKIVGNVVMRILLLDLRNALHVRSLDRVLVLIETLVKHVLLENTLFLIINLMSVEIAIKITCLLLQVRPLAHFA